MALICILFFIIYQVLAKIKERSSLFFFFFKKSYKFFTAQQVLRYSFLSPMSQCNDFKGTLMAEVIADAGPGNWLAHKINIIYKD